MMRKRKTGNGTAAKQWLYIFWNIPFIWVVKIGISGNVKRRRHQVGKTSPGFDIPVWYIPIFFAYQIEQALHSGLDFLRVPWFKGSGHTERFFIIAAIPAVILSLMVFLAEWAIYFALAFVMLAVGLGENPLNYFNQ